jgi:hypothetical protein
MIKVFAPMIGEFSANGKLPDGTEIEARIFGEESLADVAYSFRAQMFALDSGNSVLNAYFVISQTAQGGLDLHFFDTREHLHQLHWNQGDSSTRALARHHLCFEGKRDNGTPVRLSFDVNSAESIGLKFESQGRSGEWREHWQLPLKRKSETSAKKKAA